MNKLQHPIAQSLLLDPLNGALGLAQRVQDAPGLRAYVLARIGLIVPVGLLMLVTGIACAAGTVLFLGGTRPLFVLLAMLLLPFVLVGSLFVQAYTFFSWLEGRALAKALHRRPAAPGPLAARLRKLGIDMGRMPPVPWALAAIFLLLPLAMLMVVVPWLAFTLIALQVFAPIAFARLDR